MLIINIKLIHIIYVILNQIFLLKIKLFKKSTRLPANICVPSLLKCRPSLHQYSLIKPSLFTKRKLLLSQSLHRQSLTFLITSIDLNCFLTKSTKTLPLLHNKITFLPISIKPFVTFLISMLYVLLQVNYCYNLRGIHYTLHYIWIMVISGPSLSSIGVIN